MLVQFRKRMALEAATLFTLMGFVPASLGMWDLVPRTMVAQADTPGAVARAEDGPQSQLSRVPSLNTAPDRESQPPEIAVHPLAQALYSVPMATTILSALPSVQDETVRGDSGAASAGIAPSEAARRVANELVSYPTWDIKAVSAGDSAGAAVRSAHDLFAKGSYAQAVAGYVDVIDRHAGTYEALVSDHGLWAFAGGAASGAIPLSELDAIEARLPKWGELSADGRYAVLSLYNVGVEQAQDANNKAMLDRCLQRAHDTALAFVHDHPNHPLVHSAMDYYYEQASRLGDKAKASAVRELQSYAVQTSGQGIFPLIGALNALTRHWLTENDQAQASHCAGRLAGLLRSENVSAFLDNPKNYAWLKGRYALTGAEACLSIGRYEDALDWYNLGMAKAPSGGYTAELLALGKAKTAAILAGSNYDEAVQAYGDFLTSFPKSTLTDQVLLDLGGYYIKAHDYSGALQYFNETIKRYPNSPAAKLADHEMSYVMENLYGSVPVASAIASATDTRLETAQLCGPRSLEKLLSLYGISTSLDRLARDSAADSSGASMQGLIAAGEKAGLKLTGVTAKSLTNLSVPFIALVNTNHFVVVTSVSASSVTVVDTPRSPESIPLPAFLKSWNGFALVTGSTPKLAQILDSSTLSVLRGGSTSAGHSESGKDADGNCRDGAAYQVYSASSTLGQGASCNICPTCISPENVAAPSSPSAAAMVGTPGAHAAIDTFNSNMIVSEEDLGMTVRGGLRLSFTRTYINTKGFQNASRTQLGNGWTANYINDLLVSGGTVTISASETAGDGCPTYKDTDSVITIQAPLTEGYTIHDWSHTYLGGGIGFSLPSDYSYLSRRGIEYTFTKVNGPDSGSQACPFPSGGASVGGTAHYRLTDIKDKTGGALTMTYDLSGRILSVTAADGRNLLINFDGNGRVSSVALRDGTTSLQSVSYTYNTAGELIRVTDANGLYVAYEYSTDSLATGSRYISKITDKKGVATNFTYTFAQNGAGAYEAVNIRADDAIGRSSNFARSITSNVGTITSWDGTTLLRKIVNTPTGDLTESASKDYYLDATNYEHWSYEYQSGTWNFKPSQLLTRVVAPDNSTYQEYTYDTSGRLTGRRAGAGPWTTQAYTGTSDWASTVTGPDGLTTTYTFDTAGRVSGITHPSIGSNGTQYGYDSYGQITSVTNALGQQTTYAYDTKGRMTSTTNAANETTTFAYDALGNVTSVTDPTNHTTTYEYAAVGCGSCGGGAGKLIRTTDAAGFRTEFEYDANGNTTKTRQEVTTNSFVETAYTYDDLNRLTQVTSPAGSSTHQSYTYDKLHRMTSQTDFDGKVTNYTYDHRNRLTQQTDGVGTVMASVYSSNGTLYQVKDGLNHATTYTYDTAYRLDTSTDAVGKVVKYVYDTAGRLIKKGAGSTAATDPVEYFYDGTTGLMTKVRYWTGSTSYDADYTYDGLARSTKLTDWMESATPKNGLRYAYDTAGRLTTLTDYDNAALSYTYDTSGRALTMTDYHNNTTSYTYSNTGRLSTLTAPGNKTWTYTYNGIGQPTQVAIPNGMTTAYTYDNRNRLTKIEHKDGATALDSFAYTLDAQGNITRTTQVDGSYWDYTYDDRYRLATADRYSAGGIHAHYAYAYDAADNMTSKTEPLFDDFDDGDYTGWNVSAGIWSASTGRLRGTADGGSIWRNQTAGNLEADIKYLRETGSTTAYFIVYPRYINGQNYTRVQLQSGQILVDEYQNATWVTLGSTSAGAISDNTWYDLRIVCEGYNISIWKGPHGGAMSQVLSVTSAFRDSYFFCFSNHGSGVFQIDDVRIVADGLTTTTTMAYDNANELTSASKDNGTISYTYDGYGRMTGKSQGSYAATYAYRYGDKLTAVSSNFPWEGNVTYEYGGDGKRRSRNDGAVTKYRWDAGRYNLEEEDSTGVLKVTHIRRIADVSGSYPSTGAYRYRCRDELGSTRRLRDQSKNSVGGWEFDPYGSCLSETGPSVSKTFALLSIDETARVYYAPFRYFGQLSHQWLTRDPIGFSAGPNLYCYVGGNPIGYTDGLGASPDGGTKPHGRVRIGKDCSDLTGYYLLRDTKDKPNCWTPEPLKGLEPCDTRNENKEGYSTDYLYGPGGWALKIPGGNTCRISCDKGTGKPNHIECHCRYPFGICPNFKGPDHPGYNCAKHPETGEYPKKPDFMNEDDPSIDADLM